MLIEEIIYSHQMNTSFLAVWIWSTLFNILEQILIRQPKNTLKHIMTTLKRVDCQGYPLAFYGLRYNYGFSRLMRYFKFYFVIL